MDPLTGLPTLQHDLTIDRGMSFEAALGRLEHERIGGWGWGVYLLLTAAASQLRTRACGPAFIKPY